MTILSMSTFSKLKLRMSSVAEASQETRVTATDKSAVDRKPTTPRDFEPVNNSADAANIKPKDLLPDQDVQRGVQQVKAVTLT